MTDHDAFEVRFGAAVRVYVGNVSSDLDPLEFAHRIAAGEPRRHGFLSHLGLPRFASPWTLGPARVLVWAILLALLLAALIATALIIGSRPEYRLPAVIPTTLPAGTYLAVSTGGGHTCAIRADGPLECWGHNFFGQATPPEGTFVAVSAGPDRTCAIRTDGTLACWGRNLDGQTTAPAGGGHVAVDAGSVHTCAISSDGTLECWGGNDYGEATAPSGTYSAVSAGQTTTCAIQTDGTLTCWGYGYQGHWSPSSGTYVSVDAFGQCAIKTDGTLACWAPEWPTPPAGTYVTVVGDWGGPCAIRTDGALVCWGFDAAPPPPAGSYSAVSSSLPDWQACAIGTDGELTCWGGGDWIADTDMGGNWMGPPTELIPDIRALIPLSEDLEFHPGTIEFGAGGSDCGVTKPATSFSAGDTVHFAAHLGRAVGAGEVVTIAESVNGDRLDPDSFGQSPSRTFDQPGDCVGGVLHWAYVAPAGVDYSTFPRAWTTGHYVVRILVDGQVQSQGDFNVAAIGTLTAPGDPA